MTERAWRGILVYGVNSHEWAPVHGRGAPAAQALLMPSIMRCLEVYFCRKNYDTKRTD